MAGRTVKLIIDVDGKDIDAANKSIRNLGYSVATLKGGKLVLDRTEIEEARRSVNSLGTSIGTALGTVAGQAIAAVTQALMDGTRAVLQYSSKFEQINIGFTTLMGSSDAAAAHLKDLQKFASSTPFEFPDLAVASRRLQNVGIEASKVIPVMRDIGNAAAAAGASSSELDMITLAISQIIAKGKLSAEEVNQLAERGIPAWKMLSEQLGKSKGEIIKLSEQGRISSDVFLKAFQDYSQLNFGDAMQKQSRTFAGAMSTIQDITMQMSATMFEPVFDEISKFANKFAERLTAQQAKAEKEGASFGFALGEAIGDAIARGVKSKSKVEAVGSIASAVLDFVTLKSLAEGIDQGFKDFGNMSIGDLKRLDDTNTISNAVFKLKDLGNQLEEDADKAKKMQDVVSDLTSKIAFFGQNTQVAATKQKLLNDGVTDFTKGSAQQAVQLSATLDRLEALKTASDEYNKKLESAREHIEKVREAADFEIRFPNATKLQQFDLWVRQNAKNFRELNREIEATRERMKDAQDAADGLAARKTINDVIQEVNGAAASNSFDTLNQKLEGIGKTLISTGLTQFSTPQAFAINMRQYLDAYLAWEKAVGSSASIDQINKAKEAWRSFLLQVNDKNSEVSFGERDEADAFINSVIALGKAIGNIANDPNLEKFTEFKQSLEDEIELLQRGGRALTTYEMAVKSLGREYKGLLPEQEEQIKVLARQKDALIELNRQHAELKEFFKTSLRYVFDGDFKGLLQNWQDRFKDMFADKLADVFATSVLGFNPNQTNNPVAKPIVKSIDKTNEILNNILIRMGGTPVVGGGGVGSILSGILGGGAFGGGGMGPGGTANYNPNAGSGGGGGGGLGYWDGVYNSPLSGGSGGGQGGIFENLKNLFSTGPGGIFAPQKNILTGKMSGLGGILGGVGSLASLAGGMIGGRFGSVLGMAGMGMSLGAMFGPIGAIIGGIGGAILGLVGINKQRRADEQSRAKSLVEAESAIRREFDALATQLRFGTIDSASAINQAASSSASIRSQYIEAVSQLKDGKTRRIALSEVQKRIDPLIAQKTAELKGLAEIASASADRNKRILPEFAGGVFISDAFRAFQRVNGMLPGSWNGRDHIPALLADAELVLNPMQRANVIRNAGIDPFVGAGIPNYPGAAPAGGKLAGGGIASGSSVFSSSQIVVSPQIEITVVGATIDQHIEAYATSDGGLRTQIKVNKKLKGRGEIN